MKKKKRKTKSIADHPDVQRMYALSVEYCDLLEKGTRSKRYLLRHLGDLLPQLFAAAMALPYAPCSQRIQREERLILESLHYEFYGAAKKAQAGKSAYRHTVVSTADFFALAKRLRPILDGHDHYQHIFDPFKGTRPNSFALSFDLAEIWQDLKPPTLMIAMDEEAARKHAVWDWSFNVREHWGCNHFPQAIKAVMFALSRIDDYEWQDYVSNPKRLPRGQYRRTRQSRKK